MTPPYWAYPGTVVDIDLIGKRTWGGCVSRGTAALGSFGSLIVSSTAVSAIFAPNSLGLLVNQASGGIRCTDGMGLWGYGPSTNTCLWNRDLTNAAWTPTNVTALKNQVGADGTANAASSITASATLGTIAQAITAASSVERLSAYVKRLIGTGTLEMTVDGGTTWTAVVPTASYSVLNIPVQTLTNPTVGFRIGTSGDSFAVDFIHCDNIIAVTPMRVAVTSAAVAISNEEPSFGTPAVFPNDGVRIINNIVNSRRPWSLLAEFSTNIDASCVARGDVIASDAQVELYFSPNGTMSINYNGHVATTLNAGNYGMGAFNRAAVSLDGAAVKICTNGGAIASASASAGQYLLGTHFGLGSNGPGSVSYFGCLRRMSLWPYAIPAGLMQLYSTMPS